MVHWVAIRCLLTDEENRRIIANSCPRSLRRLVEQASKYSVPDAVKRIRDGRL
jgi:hypothetical protein